MGSYGIDLRFGIEDLGFEDLGDWGLRIQGVRV